MFSQVPYSSLFLRTGIFLLGGTLYSPVTSVVTFAVDAIHLLLRKCGNRGENNPTAGVVAQERKRLVASDDD